MEHRSVNKFEILEKITPLIENTAMRYNMIPIEIDFSKESGKWFLRIFLYSYERGVTLDDCEKISRSLSDFLDELIPVKYYLEVSSPGLDRKIKSNKEYTIFQGKTVNVKLKHPIKDTGGTEIRQLIGKIIDFSESEGLTIATDDETIIIPKENILRAQLEVEI